MSNLLTAIIIIGGIFGVLALIAVTIDLLTKYFPCCTEGPMCHPECKLVTYGPGGERRIQCVRCGVIWRSAGQINSMASSEPDDCIEIWEREKVNG
jgi:hypothetical protein